MTITEYFQNKINEPISNEVSDSTGRYRMWNDGSTECEVGEFLHGFIRVLKPKNILETGTYKGWSSSYMAQALKENGEGKLETLEIDQQHIETSKKRWNTLELQDWVTVTRMDSLQFEPKISYQFIFLDSEPHLRFKELIRFYPFLDPGGFVFIHDLHEHWSQEPNEEHFFGWPFGEIPQQIKDWLSDDELRTFHFPTPRGLTGIFKPTGRTYRYGRWI